jgi:hypothetical protein
VLNGSPDRYGYQQKALRDHNDHIDVIACSESGKPTVHSMNAFRMICLGVKGRIRLTTECSRRRWFPHSLRSLDAAIPEPLGCYRSRHVC